MTGTGDWQHLVHQFRLRHGLSQARMADVFGVAQRTISRWERGEDRPSVTQQKRLRDMGWEPSGSLLRCLSASVDHCPAARALTRTDRLQLLSLSARALAKRPSIANYVGHDLAPIADGVLQQILDDRDLQRAIAAGEIHSLVTTTRSVLRTEEQAQIGLFHTTISYFFDSGILYSDAIGVPAEEGAACGYRAIAMDEVALPSG
jgi:transcriptional regulator with XRE-family HTH domain